MDGGEAVVVPRGREEVKNESHSLTGVVTVVEDVS